MPVQRTKGGQYFSTLTGQSYESETEARHFDRRAALEYQRNADERNDLLGKLTPDETKLLVEQMIVAASDQAGSEQMVDGMEDFISAHPEFVADGQIGFANGSALRTFLLQQGRRQPFSLAELEEAYEELVPSGAVTIDPSKIDKSRRTAHPYSSVVRQYTTRPAKRETSDPYDILSAGAAVSHVRR